MDKVIETIKGDCLEEMPGIAGKSIDMILCDLPYQVLNKGNKDAQWDKMLPLKDLWEQYKRIIKDNGAIILFGQGMFTAQLMMSNVQMWRYNLIWKKGQRSTGFLNANRMPLRNHEDIVVFYKRQPTYNPQFRIGNKNHRGRPKEGGYLNHVYGDFKYKFNEELGNNKYPISVIEIEKEKNTYHPTQKPVKLLEYLIKTYSNEGDIILDNTMGCGSTGVAAVNTNRKFIGIEMDKQYYDIANQRIEQAYKEKKQTLF